MSSEKYFTILPRTYYHSLDKKRRYVYITTLKYLHKNKFQNVSCYVHKSLITKTTVGTVKMYSGEIFSKQIKSHYTFRSLLHGFLALDHIDN